MSKKITFENAFERLEEIARLLDAGEVGLEQSIALYEEGMELAKVCGERLNEAEARIMKLARAEDGKPLLRPMDDSEGA